jgi:hypothetical protein
MSSAKKQKLCHNSSISDGIPVVTDKPGLLIDSHSFTLNLDAVPRMLSFCATDSVREHWEACPIKICEVVGSFLGFQFNRKIEVPGATYISRIQKFSDDMIWIDLPRAAGVCSILIATNFLGKIDPAHASRLISVGEYHFLSYKWNNKICKLQYGPTDGPTTFLDETDHYSDFLVIKCRYLVKCIVNGFEVVDMKTHLSKKIELSGSYSPCVVGKWLVLVEVAPFGSDPTIIKFDSESFEYTKTRLHVEHERKFHIQFTSYPTYHAIAYDDRAFVLCYNQHGIEYDYDAHSMESSCATSAGIYNVEYLFKIADTDPHFVAKIDHDTDLIGCNGYNWSIFNHQTHQKVTQLLSPGTHGQGIVVDPNRIAIATNDTVHLFTC